MACAIDSIITLDCNDGVGGIEWVAVTEVDNIATFTADSSGNVSALTLSGGKYFYKISLIKEKGSVTVTGNDSTSTSASSWSQVLTFTTNKMSANQRRFFQLLAYNRLCVIVKDRNGNYLLIGKTGATLTQNEATTGTAFGDFNGRTITITSNEPLPEYYVASNQITNGLIQGL
jgi:hypothetical protein